MATQILVKKSGDTGNQPEVIELSYGELALNYADGKLFYKSASDEIKAISIDLDGDVTGEQMSNTIADTTVTSKLLTNYTPSQGLVAGTDTILSAFGKIDGNIALKAPLESPTFTGTVNGITQSMVGLANVDNTSDADKPISEATQSALNDKVDKAMGQGLSDENYTLVEKNKLAGIEIGAEVNVNADWTSIAGDSVILNKPILGTLAAQDGTFSGTSSGTNTGDQTITLGGDATGAGTGLVNVTLADTGVVAGQYNSSTTGVTPFTVDAKGRVTATDTLVTITPDWTSVTNKPTTLVGYDIIDAVDTFNTQVIGGAKEFTTSPIVPRPTESNQAANKAYVDDVSAGLHVHQQVHVILTVALAEATGGTIAYTNGTDGVGAKLTVTGGSTIIDALNAECGADDDLVAGVNGSRVIINGEVDDKNWNGIYVISADRELTRAADFDSPVEMAGGDFVFVTHGTTHADTGWVLSEPVTTVGTSPVDFVQFSGSGAYDAGDGLNRDGTIFSVVGTTGRIVVGPSVDLATHGTADTYRSVTTDAYGRVTSGTNPTTLDEYGITDAASSTALSNHISDDTVHLNEAQNILLDSITATSNEINYLSSVSSNIQTQIDNKQPLDADLSAIASITDNSGLLKKTSANTWSLDTTNDILNQGFTVKAVSQGVYSDGTVIEAGTRLEDIIKNMLQTIVPAVYIQPTLSISTVTTLAQEFGTNVSAILNSIFTQNDAGSLIEYRVKQGSSIIYNATAIAQYTAAFQLLANTAFTAEVDYSTGPQKYDNMGNISGSPIVAGTRVSNSINFVSQRKTFWNADTSTTAATTSSQIRALASSALGHSNGSAFAISIPVGTRRITFAYPATLRACTSVSYVQAGNASVLDTFTQTTVNVEGANGAASVAYRVYTYIAPIAFGSAATYNVVI